MTVAEFNECVDLYADNVYRFILKNIKDKEKAKDIVQDTFEKLWVKVSEVQATNAKSYMFTAAYRTMVDAIRKEKFKGNYDETTLVNLTTGNNYSGQKEALNLALDRLPEIQKTVILLRDYEGYNYAEIGEITNLTESQVKVYIYRARVALKEFIVKLENVI